jgi:hypothetical protein
MARLADNVRQALGSFWNLAHQAAYSGYTATDTITAASNIMRESGQSLTFGESSAVATLYGYARRMFNAAQVVQSLQDHEVIGPDAIATPPWARDEREQAALPIWHVHFDFTYTDQSGVTQTDRRVSVFRMTLPETMGELRDAIGADAEAMAAKYNVDLIGADIREIHSV